jgi:hypothetical protein
VCGRSVAVRLPATTSSTRSPARTSAASASVSPTICSVTPMTAKSPLAHVACCFAVIAAKSGCVVGASRAPDVVVACMTVSFRVDGLPAAIRSIARAGE